MVLWLGSGIRFAQSWQRRPISFAESDYAFAIASRTGTLTPHLTARLEVQDAVGEFNRESALTRDLEASEWTSVVCEFLIPSERTFA